MKYLIAIILTGILISMNIFHLAGNDSASEPRGIWRLTNDDPKRGDYVVLKRLLKERVGVPGDYVCATPEGTTVNHGPVFPFSAPDSSYVHQPWFGCLTLKSGWYWILGHHPKSFDSRYFGPIPESMINSTAKPLWTERPYNEVKPTAQERKNSAVHHSIASLLTYPSP